MTKKERVKAVLAGEKTQGVPACFSMHFDPSENSGPKGIQAHLRYFRESDCDICKIMNENLVPGDGTIHSAADYGKKVVNVGIDAPFMQKQLAFVKEIMAGTSKDAYVVGTLHGICASGIHPIEIPNGLDYTQARNLQKQFLLEGEEEMLQAMERITDGMCALAKAYIDLGCDGVYYAALGGETRFFTDEEFERWIKPFDLKIMKAIKEAGGDCILHICKDGLNMKRYEKDYNELADVVNWGVYETHFSLEEGRKLFPGTTVLGGLPNRTGVLVDGTEEEVKTQVKDVIESFGTKHFILGADCTLATEQKMNLLRAAVETAHEME